MMVMSRGSRCAIACLLLMPPVLATTVPVARASTELRAEGGFFRDAAGRVVVLRGLNVAGNAKVPPFRPIASPALLDPLPRWGMNVVRLLFTWEAYEPQPGMYDEGYLEYVARTAEAAWARRLYVVVDFHQDAFSRFSIGGCGDGFPAWAIPANVARDQPDNGAGCADWGIRMITAIPMHLSWGAFWRGEGGVRGRFLAMVERVARRMARIPGVVGYDVMNEPWGNEGTEIPALHRDAAAAIRRVDPSAILFLSPHALTSSGLVQTQLPRPELANVAYAPHFYDGGVLLAKRWNGSAPSGPFAAMRGKADEWGVPLFVGELGGPATAENIGGYMDALFAELDQRFSSAAQWVYTPGWTAAAKDGWNDEDLSNVDDAGRLRANFRVRPYAQKIAGTPLRTSATNQPAPSDNVFELAWDHLPAAGVTEIFLPRQTFLGTAHAAVETEGEAVRCSFAGDHLRCSSAVAGGKRVVVRAGVGPDPGAGAGGCDCRLAGARGRRLPGLTVVLLLGLAVLRQRRGDRSRCGHGRSSSPRGGVRAPG